MKLAAILCALTVAADTSELPQGFFVITPQERSAVAERLEMQGKEVMRLRDQLELLKLKQGCA